MLWEVTVPPLPYGCPCWQLRKWQLLPSDPAGTHTQRERHCLAVTHRQRDSPLLLLSSHWNQISRSDTYSRDRDYMRVRIPGIPGGQLSGCLPQRLATRIICVRAREADACGSVDRSRAPLGSDFYLTRGSLLHHTCTMGSLSWSWACEMLEGSGHPCAPSSVFLEDTRWQPILR